MTVARIARPAAGLAGLAGALSCSGAMVLTALGTLGATAGAGGASMAAMGEPARHPGAVSLLGSTVDFLVAAGPLITVASSLAFTAALLSRRRLAGGLALVGGVILVVGMYAQASRVIMYAAIATGFAVWAAAYVMSRRVSPPSPARQPDQAAVS